MRQIDKFESLIDKMIAENSLTKAQLLDAFHKSNSNSLEEMPHYNFNNYSVTKLPDLSSTTNYIFKVKINQ